MAEKKKVLMLEARERDLSELQAMIRAAYPAVEFTVVFGRPVDAAEVIARGRDAAVLFCHSSPITEEIFAGLPGLRAVVFGAVGFDAADPAIATRYGVAVTNVPDYCVDEVSAHTVALLLYLQRGFDRLVNWIKDGGWGIQPVMTVPRLAGKTVGLFGFGRIGRAVARKLAGFDLNLIACDPFIPPAEAKPYGVKLMSFEAMLEQSDFVSLHAPLDASTRGVFGEAALRRMKPTAYLINCARGPIVDTEALYRALTEKRLAGAGLDVLANEPPTAAEQKLIALPNVVVTPHSAFYSAEAYADSRRKAVDEVVRALRGEPPRMCVNPEVLPQLGFPA